MFEIKVLSRVTETKALANVEIRRVDQNQHTIEIKELISDFCLFGMMFVFSCRTHGHRIAVCVCISIYIYTCCDERKSEYMFAIAVRFISTVWYMGSNTKPYAHFVPYTLIFTFWISLCSHMYAYILSHNHIEPE